MLKNNKYINLILYLPISNQYFVVRFSSDLNLEKNLKLLKEMIKNDIKDNYSINENINVYLKTTFQKCDLLIPISKLNLYDNATLVLL